jgi:hypothetical protein
VTELLIQRIDPSPAGPAGAAAPPAPSPTRMPIDDLDEDPYPIDRSVYDDDLPPGRGAP